MCLCVRERKRKSNKASSAFGLFGPKLSSDCWCWNGEPSAPCHCTVTHRRAYIHNKESTTNTYAHIKKPSKFVTKSSPLIYWHHPCLFYQCILSSFIHLPNLSVPLSDTFYSHIFPLRRALFSYSSAPFILILFPCTPIHPTALDYFENVSCPHSFLFYFSLSLSLCPHPSLPPPHLSPLLSSSLSSQRWF